AKAGVALSRGSDTGRSATATTIPLTGVSGWQAGSLTANVTVNAQSSGAVPVATVLPVVTASSTAVLATAGTLTINGFGFDPTAANDVVTLNAGSYAGLSATANTITLTGVTGLIAGSLTAVVTADSASSGAAVQVATV